jgi:hypothetical protein
MVRIINVHQRENEKGSYVSLELQGDIVMLQSQNTGRFYATAKRCFMYSTFNFESAKSLIGQQIPGTIARVECEAYDYIVPESGEVLKLTHSYAYVPEGANVPVSSEMNAQAKNAAALA